MTNAQLPELLSETEEGFVDTVFRIVEQRQEDGALVLIAKAASEGKRVAVEVEIPASWEEQDSEHFPFKGVVTYRSLGPESDLLLTEMKRHFASNVAVTAMVQEVSFTAIALACDPRRLADGPIHLKLFAESENEDRYAEFYTNVDVQHGKLWVREKDPDYRTPFLLAMSSPSRAQPGR